MTATGPDGKRYEMDVINRKTFIMWLAGKSWATTVEITAVADDDRSRHMAAMTRTELMQAGLHELSGPGDDQRVYTEEAATAQRHLRGLMILTCASLHISSLSC